MPFNPARMIAARNDLIADALQLPQPKIAAIFDDQFETAGCSQTVDRRRAEAATMASLTSLHRVAYRPAMAITGR